jgi:CheY-like chemotaxis protein/anti-sigma regulatory factor (Ser/Thr protein kinase)
VVAAARPMVWSVGDRDEWMFLPPLDRTIFPHRYILESSVPCILIVDDSLVQLRVVERLLQKHLPNTAVLSASGGDAALEMLDEHSVDLVLTDLQMPDGDGLHLVKEMRSNHPLVPVILMTGFGNEETATAALLAGAASYIPKRQLDAELIETVENVLELGKSNRQQSQILESLEECDFTFTLDNDVSLITPLITYLQDQIGHTRAFDASNLIRIGVALQETLANAIYHGNLEVSSDLRQEDESIFYLLANQRRTEELYCNRRVHVRATISSKSLEFTIRDEGPGFCVKKVLDPEQPVDLERIGGRGMTLIRAFMDVVYHNSTGNEIHMIKYPECSRFQEVEAPDNVDCAVLA